MTEKESFLSNSWILYQHFINDDYWTHDSYKNIAQIATISELDILFDFFYDSLHKSMFFFMKNDVFPSWDDSANLNSGTICIKVNKNDNQIFRELCYRSCKDKIIDESDTEYINGISISPKYFSCIIKIWMSEDFTEDMIDDLKIFDIVNKKSIRYVRNKQFLNK